MLMEEIVGSTPAQLAALDDDHMLALLGIELGPVRMKCARLPLTVLQGALDNLHHSNGKELEP